MSLEQIFRQAIENALNYFEATENKISLEDAKAVAHIRQLLKVDMELAELRNSINSYIINMTTKFFSFLPFVNDLKVLIKRVLESPEFSSYNCLFEDYKSFKTKIVNGNNHFQASDSSHFISRDEYNKGLADLGKELRSKIQYYKEENALLKLELGDAENENRSIRQELLELQKRMQSSDNVPVNFESIISQKDREIAKLKAIIFQLKLENAKLKQNSQSGSTGLPVAELTPIPNQSYKPGIFLSS